MQKVLSVFLFDQVTLLDFVGPVEVFSRLSDQYRCEYISLPGGEIRGSAGLGVESLALAAASKTDLLLIPGGWGTRALVKDTTALEAIRGLAQEAETVLSVCTGSGLLAAAGVLDGKSATSNKRAWDWATQQGPNVNWIRRARWVRDGRFWTSSGVSAGIDLSLDFLAEHHGSTVADEIAGAMEYIRNRDPENDPFA